MVIETLIYGAGILTGVAIVYIMTFTSPVRYKKQCDDKNGKDNRYETVVLDYGTFVIPKTVHDDDYNKYVNGYDKYIRENFEQYIRDNLQKWWDEYENARRKELAPLSRTICKYVKVAPVRLKGSWSTEWYAYVKHGAFNVKVRYIHPYFDEQYNMEIKITNTNITEDENGNQI